MTIPRPQKKASVNANRLNFILAIVFLLAVILAGRLFDLQVWQYNLYKDKAAQQQQTEAKLDPERGQILINNYSPSLGTNTLSSVALNKNFAILYAVPKDFAGSLASTTANELYELFDRADVEKAVDTDLAQSDNTELDQELKYIDTLPLTLDDKDQRKADIIKKGEGLVNDQQWQDFRKMKWDLEINDRKQAILNNYLARLTRPNDVYEVLQKKVLDDKLLELYAALLSTSTKITADDLEIKNNKIFLKSDSSDGSGPGLAIKGLGYQMTRYRYYPEGDMAAQLLGFVNYDNKGNYGLEGYFDSELAGQAGSLKSERGGESGLTIVDGQEYIKPQDGSDIVLTLDRAVEYEICSKLEEAQPKYKFDSGTIIVADPETGAIIAMCSWPQFDPNNYQDVKDIKYFINPAVSYQYEPGSVFKAITMAVALDQNKVTPDTTYNDLGQVTVPGWPKTIKNSDFATAGGHGLTSMKTVLEKSLNTGAIFAMGKVGAALFSQYVQNFGFGQKTGIELGNEAAGNINNLLRDKIRPVDAATSAFGQGLSVTPLQMLMSYAAVANQGVLMKPYLVKEIDQADGTKVVTAPQTVRQVISKPAATILSGMLVDVVENGTAKKAQVAGYYVAGKTGTAQVSGKNGEYLTGDYIHTFVGYAPVDNPRFVMLVKLDNPKGFNYAESTATPLFGEIADFLLKYYQIPKTR